MKMMHVTIMCSKFSEAIEFYKEIAGLEIVGEIRGKGPNDIVFLANQKGETCVELIDNPEAAYNGAGISMGFAVKDVEGYREELAGKGLAVTPMITPNPVTKFFFTNDPNGVQIQFINE